MNLREMQQEFENSVSASIDSAEGIHRMAAAQVFEQLASVTALNALVGSVRPLYETGAAQAFELGRSLNRSGGEIARSVLDRTGT